MPTIELELLKSKTFIDGRHPVYIRVNNLKPARKIVATAFPSEYIGKVHKCLKGTSVDIINKNIEIENKFTKYSNIFKELEASGKKWKPEDVFAITPESEKEDKKTFWDIADLYIDGKSGMTKQTFRGIIKKFETWCKNDSLLLSEIDTRIISNYMHFMRTVPQRNGRPNREKTVKSNLKVLRFVSNFGSRNRYDTRPDDLHNFKLPSEEETETEHLTQLELKAFAEVNVTEGTIKKQVQDAFLLAIYLRGMRIGDVIELKQKLFKGGRLIYDTGKNKKRLSMQLVPKANEIINKYLNGNEYLFDFFKWKYEPKLSPEQNDENKVKHIKSRTSLINKNLKIIAKVAGIEKNLRSHIARHSFSNILDSKNIDIATIQGLLGHGTRAMTERYIKKIRKSDVLDQAVKDVFGD